MTRSLRSNTELLRLEGCDAVFSGKVLVVSPLYVPCEQERTGRAWRQLPTETEMEMSYLFTLLIVKKSLF